ncbi:MAG: hypothetical protein LBL41_03510 [Bifidobacteriaceae bacterium]|nr:hypothetical protein [Bifidobacteriaceae bacterium]
MTDVWHFRCSLITAVNKLQKRDFTEHSKISWHKIGFLALFKNFYLFIRYLDDKGYF